MNQRTLTKAEWAAEARALFGDDPRDWVFVCPACGHRQSFRDLVELVDKDEAWKMLGFSCIGRLLPAEKRRSAFRGEGPGPCDYAGGGLFRLNPVKVIETDDSEHCVFEFANLSAEAS